MRFTFEPHGPMANSAAATAPPTQGCPYKQVLGIANAVRADLCWFNGLTAEVFLSSEQEVAAVKTRMPPTLARVPQYYIAPDLNGGQRQTEIYFSPLIKRTTTGTNSDDATFNVLSRLDPGFAAPLKVIGDFRATRQEPLAIQMIGIDCVAPRSRREGQGLYTRRVQCLGQHSASRHAGRAADDEMTWKGLEILGEIWNLLLDGPEATADSSVSKPVNDSTNIWHTNVIYSWEVQPGKDLPDVKVHVPLWQYSSSNRATLEIWRKSSGSRAEAGVRMGRIGNRSWMPCDYSFPSLFAIPSHLI
ncbi:hypothetical protein DL762_006721 [Monosporascus cannonballus]|uniref:Uncharacterized protein n=1 Tax=Monosporascus cannonballus TaxID=155416 RepID=A0ABY0H1R2_9PEZI|nr:hypothetical protein DL762_006721 [Monosporascus cannonballus]RYO92521.1 hypothetical protein DL763_004650 [Monosporascus cannonballus]